MWWNTSRPLYVFMVLAVILASHLELRSQDALIDMSAAALQALRLTAIAAMEQGEYIVLEREAAHDANAAEQYQQAAKFLEYRSNVDTIYAERNRKRGHYFEQIASQEQAQADAAMKKVQRDEALRVELLANLTADEQQEADLEQQERDRTVHSSLCNATRIFETVCALIGGAPGLTQRQELDEQRKIVQESQALTELEKREFIDELVAKILQGKTNEYNKTAADLFHLAVLWDTRAHQDAEAAARDGETAAELFAEEERIETRIQKEKGWKNENMWAVGELLSEAERYGRVAYRYALDAVLLAFAALLYFLPTAGLKSASLARTLMHPRDVEDNLRTFSYCVQHALIFLLVTGMIDNDYLLYLDRYDVPKRAVIVIWFAYLAAGLQTILLHTVPHCMAEYPFDRRNLGDISLQFFLRMFATMAFFTMELLIMWLTFRDVLFTADSVRSLSSWSVRLVGILMLAAHIAVFEPRGVSTGSRVADEQSTVLMSDDEEDDDESQATESQAVTESSPLRGDAISATPTEDLPLIYFRMASPNRTGSAGSSSSRSPYTMNIDEEYTKLSITFEVLLTVCAFCVLRNGMPLTWTHSVTTSLAFLSLFAAIFFIVALSLVMCRPGAPTIPGDWMLGLTKKHTYTSIDV
jgi:hypothetical protein